MVLNFLYRFSRLKVVNKQKVLKLNYLLIHPRNIFSLLLWQKINRSIELTPAYKFKFTFQNKSSVQYKLSGHSACLYFG